LVKCSFWFQIGSKTVQTGTRASPTVSELETKNQTFTYSCLLRLTDNSEEARKKNKEQDGSRTSPCCFFCFSDLASERPPRTNLTSSSVLLLREKIEHEQ